MVRRLSVAISDGLLALSAFSNAQLALSHATPVLSFFPISKILTPQRTDALMALAWGLSIVGAAAALGVLRFADSAERLRPAHEFASNAGKVIGTPLICAASMHRSAGVLSMLGGTAVLTTALTAMFLFLEMVERGNARERYFKHMPIVFVIGSLLAGLFSENWPAVAGAVLIIAGGLGIGADLDQSIFGIRRVDYFHVLLAASYWSFAASV